MKKGVAALIFSVIFLVFISVLGVYFASARSNGMSGYSASGCVPCHSSSASASVSVSINGPTTVSVEETNTYTISVTGGPSGAFGFDLSATDGTIIVTDAINTQLKDSDLTHTVGGILQSSWLFDWKAPSSPGAVTLKVAALSADGDGKSNSDDLWNLASLSITVEAAPPEPQPPVASFTFSPLSPVVDELVTFDASGSSDPDGTIVSYEWDFGDGSFGSGVSATHAYSSSSDYTVTLVVVDSDGLTNNEEKMVTVGVAIVHDVAIKDVTVFPNLVVAGGSVDISVILENQGTVEEAFDVNVYYNGNLIETHANIVLASGGVMTESFIWNTTNVADGVYTISARVSEIEGETDIDDNLFVDGGVKVTSVLNLTLDVDPDSLNPRSRGRWTTAYIELPVGFNASDIDLSSVLLNGSISAEFKPAEVGDCDNDGILDLMVKFDRGALIELVENATGGRIILNVSCQVSGTLFEGYDSIREISHD